MKLSKACCCLPIVQQRCQHHEARSMGKRRNGALPGISGGQAMAKGIGKEANVTGPIGSGSGPAHGNKPTCRLPAGAARRSALGNRPSNRPGPPMPRTSAGPASAAGSEKTTDSYCQSTRPAGVGRSCDDRPMGTFGESGSQIRPRHTAQTRQDPDAQGPWRDGLSISLQIKNEWPAVATARGRVPL